jgi:predicted MFS family arabinose efflux permease
LRRQPALSVRVILIAGFLVLFVGGGARFAIGLTFKPMVDELGWARGQLGLAVGLYMVVSAFATFIAGRLADRLSARALLGAGTVLGGVGIGLMSLVSAPWQAMVLYGLVFAIGNGAASPTTVGVMVTRAAPQRAGLANAAAISGQSFGQLVMIALLAAVLVQIGWRSVFVWLAAAHLLLLPVFLLALPGGAQRHSAHAPAAGMSLRGAARTRQFWLLLAIYAICGLDDFFVGTHVVAFAQDRGVEALFAGNLLALMGLTALIGVLAAGAISDRSGPVLATAAAFGARIAVFALIAIDQSALSISIFALVYGATFLVTAPLTVLFVRESFGMKHLGALTGLVTMVHQVFGGVGAYGGALVFDATGSYHAAFILALAASAVALVLTLTLRRTRTTEEGRSQRGGAP